MLLGGTLLGCVVALSGCTPPADGPQARATTASPDSRPGGGTPARKPASTPAQTPTGSAQTPTGSSQDPARHAATVVARCRQAGVNPQLLMAILYNESYKPHDPALERAWQRLDPDAAFGIANMHRAAFEDARRGRPFADRAFEELPDDPALAIEAAAWYLHDLAAALPRTWPGPYTRDELLALGYNAGPGNMAAFAGGAAPGPVARSYLDRLRGNWKRAGQAVRA